MSGPTKHYGKWRIRWTDDNGKRQSATFSSYKRACAEAEKHNEAKIEKEKITLSLRVMDWDLVIQALADYAKIIEDRSKWEPHLKILVGESDRIRQTLVSQMRQAR